MNKQYIPLCKISWFLWSMNIRLWKCDVHWTLVTASAGCRLYRVRARFSLHQYFFYTNFNHFHSVLTFNLYDVCYPRFQNTRTSIQIFSSHEPTWLHIIITIIRIKLMWLLLLLLLMITDFFFIATNNNILLEVSVILNMKMYLVKVKIH